MVTNPVVFTFYPSKSLQCLFLPGTPLLVLPWFISSSVHAWSVARASYMSPTWLLPLLASSVLLHSTCLWVGVTFLKCRFSSWNLPYFQITVRVKFGHLERPLNPPPPISLALPATAPARLSPGHTNHQSFPTPALLVLAARSIHSV